MTLTQLQAAIAETGDVWIKGRCMEGVNYNGFTTTRTLANMEDAIAIKVASIVTERRAIIPEHIIRKHITDYEKEKKKSLHEHQAQGVTMIVQSGLSVLTGGPGTGKTTVLDCAAYVLRKCYKNIRLMFCAPTGKAARRITESTGEKASTLHRLLGLGYESRSTKFMSQADVIIIDESSMADIELASALFKTSLTGKKIIFVGDVDQIPSVGAGAILRDLIRSKVVPCTMLTKTFRQKDGALLHNIKEVRKGSCLFTTGKEFQQVLVSNQIKTERLDYLICGTYLERVRLFGTENVVVLLPYRKAGYGSDHVNALLQERCNPRGKAYKVNDNFTIKVGDPIMQLVNRPECVNGEVGKVIDVTEKGVKVSYTDGIVTYSAREIPEQLTLAYAMSVTKSQGSEYKSVIEVHLNSHKNALNKNILYTGMSRAKQNLVLITQNEALLKSINTTASERKTFLAEKINALVA